MPNNSSPTHYYIFRSYLYYIICLLDNFCYIFIVTGCWVEAEGKELKWAKGGKKQVWHHPTCFKERKSELDIDQNITADLLDVCSLSYPYFSFDHALLFNLNLVNIFLIFIV